MVLDVDVTKNLLSRISDLLSPAYFKFSMLHISPAQGKKSPKSYCKQKDPNNKFVNAVYIAHNLLSGKQVNCYGTYAEIRKNRDVFSLRNRLHRWERYLRHMRTQIWRENYSIRPVGGSERYRYRTVPFSKLSKPSGLSLPYAARASIIFLSSIWGVLSSGSILNILSERIYTFL